MSKIINENTGQADYFQVDGSIIDATNQPKVDGGAAMALGTGNEPDLDNVALGDNCTIYVSQLTANTGGDTADHPTYRIDANVVFPNSYFSSDEVYYKGNLAAELSGGQVITPDCMHEFTGIYQKGITTAVRNGYWNPVTASWTTDPSGQFTTYAVDQSLTEKNVTYGLGATNPVTTGYIE